MYLESTNSIYTPDSRHGGSLKWESYIRIYLNLDHRFPVQQLHLNTTSKHHRTAFVPLALLCVCLIYISLLCVPVTDFSALSSCPPPSGFALQGRSRRGYFVGREGKERLGWKWHPGPTSRLGASTTTTGCITLRPVPEDLSHHHCWLCCVALFITRCTSFVDGSHPSVCLVAKFVRW